MNDDQNKQDEKTIRLVDDHDGGRIGLGHPSARASAEESGGDKNLQKGHSAPEQAQEKPPPTQPPPKSDDSGRSATPPAVRKEKSD